MAADGHLGMTALLRVTLASAGLSCFALLHTFSRTACAAGQTYSRRLHSVTDIKHLYTTQQHQQRLQATKSYTPAETTWRTMLHHQTVELVSQNLCRISSMFISRRHRRRHTTDSSSSLHRSSAMALQCSTTTRRHSRLRPLFGRPLTDAFFAVRCMF